MDDSTEDLLAKVKKELVVEIPVKRSSRASAVKKPKYVEDIEEGDELEDKKPIIKDFAVSRKRKGEGFLPQDPGRPY
jgi:hypothetical protein